MKPLFPARTRLRNYTCNHIPRQQECYPAGDERADVKWKKDKTHQGKIFLCRRQSGARRS
eukprot:CCRYP_015294-RB/>CCRYP_015294-RB protein AED:0.47 eAED:1.00 QI:0/-1/0/1/-1/0/1/0/59